MKTSLVVQKVSFFHGMIDPNWVDGNPGQPGPIFRTSISDYIGADLLRDISANLHNRETSTKLHIIARVLVVASARDLVAYCVDKWDANGICLDAVSDA